MFVDSSDMFPKQPRVRGGIAESRMGCRVRCGVRVRRGIKELECGVADLRGDFAKSGWGCGVRSGIAELQGGLRS